MKILTNSSISAEVSQLIKLNVKARSMEQMKKLLSLAFILLTPAISLAASGDVLMQYQAQHIARPQDCKSNDVWAEPTAARHIYGNAWFVGTCAISVILIATPHGHFLIDGATEEAVPSIESNITSLGVNLSDIKYILVSHEHIDHVGGIATLQSDTGARVISRSDTIGSLKSGKSDRRDPQFLILTPFTPIAQLQAIPDNGRLVLGETSIQNIPMSGHTPGGSGWTWRECEKNVCVNMVFSDSVGAISDKEYRFSQIGSIADSLLETTKRLEDMPCDILLTGHVKQSNLLNRLDEKAPLIDALACKQLAKFGRDGLKKRIEEEQIGKAP
jgi:metallo-beta-lactamase class B